jgi:DNA-binding FadR family transcriptional regulator
MPLSDVLNTQGESLFHHFEARMVLEPAAAALAAKRCTPKDVDQLNKNLKIFKKNLASENLVGLIQADIQFHRLVANATENKTIEILMNTITRHDFQGWKASLRTKNRPIKTVDEHKKVIEAIAARDEKQAYKAMHAHLSAARKNLGLDGSK